MSYLLDTNVISEIVKVKPNANVLAWITNIPDIALFISVLSLGEIRKGVEKLEDISRKERLRIWLEHELPKRLKNRVLSVDQHIADRWGRLQYEMQRPIPAIDSLIAATALHYDLALVTRNGGDFKYPGLNIINPWEYREK